MTLTTIAPGAARHAFMVSAARVAGVAVEDHFGAALDGTEVPAVVVSGRHGGLVHLVDLPAETPAGARLEVEYRGRITVEHEPRRRPVPDRMLLEYLRPSRYAESDEIIGLARTEVAGLPGPDKVAAVVTWVRNRIAYAPGASRATDGAVHTLLSGAGVCRDYAHLVVALLRAVDIPARVASCYAPGLAPMDFHAVCEAYVADSWHVFDATGLAPRQSLVRIATGRDAADTAFCSSYGTPATLDALRVLAVVDGDLPRDNDLDLVRLA